MNELTQALIAFAVALLTAAGPVLIAFIIAWIKAKTDEIKSKLSAEQRTEFDWAVKIAVQAAEQSGLTGAIKDKKIYAEQVASNLLKSRGVNIDLKALDDAIEAAVWTEINSPASDVASTLAYQAQSKGPVIPDKSDQPTPN